MGIADTYERQMLDLINAERRANGLNELQLEVQLNAAAADHSIWQLEQDVFSHTGAGGSSAGDRIEQAGFDFTGRWSWAENLAWQSLRGDPGLSDDVIDLHNALMNSPGHRANILDPNVTYIGIGIELGEFNGHDAIIVTQNFARTAAEVMLDTGEGPDTDTAAQPETAPTSPQQTETLAEDTESASADTPPETTDRTDQIELTAAGQVNGRGGNDVLRGSMEDDQLNGGTGADRLFGRGGDDSLAGDAGHDRLFGGGGADTLEGGAGQDLLKGGASADILDGGNGSDRLRGGRGDDSLEGDAGADLLLGDAGRDLLQGGSGNDRLFGGKGSDSLSGGDDNDQLRGGQGADTLEGGIGADTFYFSPGQDQVTDFDQSEGDLINLGSANGVSSFADLMANHITQDGADLLITSEDGHSLRLLNTDLASLSSSDFIF